MPYLGACALNNIQHVGGAPPDSSMTPSVVPAMQTRTCWPARVNITTSLFALPQARMVVSVYFHMASMVINYYSPRNFSSNCGTYSIACGSRNWKWTGEMLHLVGAFSNAYSRLDAYEARGKLDHRCEATEEEGSPLDEVLS